jgi:methylase of polypeptide subunit release factors
MLISHALNWGASTMEQSLDDANLRLDSSLLLSNVLNISREKLYASLSDSLTIEQQQNFQDLVCKRAQGYPLAYHLRT